MRKSRTPSQTSDLAFALGKAGRSAELRELLAEALEWYEKNHRGAIALVSIYSNLGDNDRAFEWVEKALQEHSGYLLSIFVDYAFEKLRYDPRMGSIKRRMGLD